MLYTKCCIIHVVCFGFVLVFWLGLSVLKGITLEGGPCFQMKADPGPPKLQGSLPQSGKGMVFGASKYLER